MSTEYDDRFLDVLMRAHLPKVIDAYREVRGVDPEVKPLAMEWDLEGKVPEGSIARHHEKDGQSVITIRPKAFRNIAYLETVIKHELVHYLLRTPDALDEHGLDFQLMCEYLGIPPRYRD